MKEARQVIAATQRPHAAHATCRFHPAAGVSKAVYLVKEMEVCTQPPVVHC